VADIDVSVEGSTASVTLNPPSSRNAVTLAMWKEIARIFRELGREPRRAFAEKRQALFTGR